MSNSVSLTFSSSSYSYLTNESCYRFYDKNGVLWESVTQFLVSKMFGEKEKRVIHSIGSNICYLMKITTPRISFATRKRSGVVVYEKYYSIIPGVKSKVVKEWSNISYRNDCLKEAITCKFDPKQNKAIFEKLVSTGNARLRYHEKSSKIFEKSWIIPQTIRFLDYIRKTYRESTSINGYKIPTRIEDCPRSTTLQRLNEKGGLVVTVSKEYTTIVTQVINLVVRIAPYEGQNRLLEGMEEDAIYNIINYDPISHPEMKGVEVCFGYIHFIKESIIDPEGDIKLYDQLPNFCTLYECTKVLLDKVDTDLNTSMRDNMALYIALFAKWLVELCPGEKVEYVKNRLNISHSLPLSFSPLTRRNYRSTLSFNPYIQSSGNDEFSPIHLGEHGEYHNNLDPRDRLSFINLDGNPTTYDEYYNSQLFEDEDGDEEESDEEEESLSRRKKKKKRKKGKDRDRNPYHVSTFVGKSVDPRKMTFTPTTQQHLNPSVVSNEVVGGEDLDVELIRAALDAGVNVKEDAIKRLEVDEKKPSTSSSQDVKSDKNYNTFDFRPPNPLPSSSQNKQEVPVPSKKDDGDVKKLDIPPSSRGGESVSGGVSRNIAADLPAFGRSDSDVDGVTSIGFSDVIESIPEPPPAPQPPTTETDAPATSEIPETGSVTVGMSEDGSGIVESM